jgi:hypothetical protein
MIWYVIRALSVKSAVFFDRNKFTHLVSEHRAEINTKGFKSWDLFVRAGAKIKHTKSDASGGKVSHLESVLLRLFF